MSKDDFRKNYQETKLYHDVMGIGLAIWGNAGDTPLFREIDRSLESYDINSMRLIKDAFISMPESLQSIILAEIPDPQSVDSAIERFEQTYMRKNAKNVAQTA